MDTSRNSDRAASPGSPRESGPSGGVRKAADHAVAASRGGSIAQRRLARGIAAVTSSAAAPHAGNHAATFGDAPREILRGGKVSAADAPRGGESRGGGRGRIGADREPRDREARGGDGGATNHSVTNAV